MNQLIVPTKIFTAQGQPGTGSAQGKKTIFIIHTGEAKCVILCGTTVPYSDNSSV